MVAVSLPPASRRSLKRFWEQPKKKRVTCKYFPVSAPTTSLEAARLARRNAERELSKFRKRRNWVNGQELLDAVKASTRVGDDVKILLGIITPLWAKAVRWAGEVRHAFNGKVWESPRAMWKHFVQLDFVVRDGKHRQQDAEGMICKELTRRLGKKGVVIPRSSSPHTRELARQIMDLTHGQGLQAWQFEDLVAYVVRNKEAVARSGVGYALACASSWLRDRRTIWHVSQHDHPAFTEIRRLHREGVSPTPWVTLGSKPTTAIKPMKPSAKTYTVEVPTEEARQKELADKAEALLEERAREAYLASDAFKEHSKLSDDKFIEKAEKRSQWLAQFKASVTANTS